MKKEIEKLRKQIEKLKNDNNAMWELNQKANKEIKSLQGSSKGNSESHGEVQKLNKTIIQLKNDQVQYMSLNDKLTRENTSLKECVSFYAELSSWPLLTDEERSYPIIIRTDEEVINDRIRGGRLARETLRDIEKITKE